jgi:general secretion pathway protein G
MIVPLNRRAVASYRAGFTLLEVLVVVAILVILASVASIYVFGFLSDAKVDTAENQCAMFESQCKSYMAKNGGDLSADFTLMELVTPSNTNRMPLIEGGPAALNGPWPGSIYQVSVQQDQNGAPDPVVSIQNPTNGLMIYSRKRKLQSGG